MTLPSERTRSIILTERFLRNLADPKVTPGLPKRIREHAKMLLRHYPTEYDLDVVIDNWDQMVSFCKNIECPFGDPSRG